MIGLFFFVMFMVPVGTLMWRIVVTKSRSQAIRVGAAAAAMATSVGAFLVYDQITHFSLEDWRDVLALVASLMASAYLIFWALRRHGNRRHRTLSLIAAVIGLVPAVGAFATAIFFQE